MQLLHFFAVRHKTIDPVILGYFNSYLCSSPTLIRSPPPYSLMTTKLIHQRFRTSFQKLVATCVGRVNHFIVLYQVYEVVIDTPAKDASLNDVAVSMFSEKSRSSRGRRYLREKETWLKQHFLIFLSTCVTLKVNLGIATSTVSKISMKKRRTQTRTISKGVMLNYLRGLSFKKDLECNCNPILGVIELPLVRT